MSSETETADTQGNTDNTWTYPTRNCRLCHEEVVPTVTVSNPGLPAPFRSTTITYTSEDGGRLIKPCKCKGTQRYIHEGCLSELRAKSPQKNAYLKCNLCEFQYSTKRLLIHDILLSRVARVILTILIVVVLMFVLGFVADPIINLYVDPVETLAGQRYWEPVKVENMGEEAIRSWWMQHFMKGLISVGLMGSIKAVLLANPWQFWHPRHSGLRTTTGRDRAVNISWIAVVIGVGSALYFFYKQVAKFSHSTLSKFANDVIEVQMSDDDEDLRVPQSTNGTVPKATFPVKTPGGATSTAEAAAPGHGGLNTETRTAKPGSEDQHSQSETALGTLTPPATSFPPLQGAQSSHRPSSTEAGENPSSWSSAIREAQTPGWSFNSV